jgi:hypothetical protein
MPRACLRNAAAVGVAVALVAGLFDGGSGLGLDRRAAGAEPSPPPPRVAAVVSGAAVPAARPWPPRGAAGRRADGHAEGTGGWWFGTAAIALALAVYGAVSLATRRGWSPVPPGGALRVVGRASLSPRHTVYLLNVGSRFLIVGTGPQGGPSLLGELTDPDDLRRLLPQRTADQAAGTHADEPPPAPPSLLDRIAAAWRRPAGDDQ